MLHVLKIHPTYFESILFGKKKFEIRQCEDRNFNVGDSLLLKEYCLVEGYSGKEILVDVTYMIPSLIELFGMHEDLCVMGFEVVKEEEE